METDFKTVTFVLHTPVHLVPANVHSCLCTSGCSEPKVHRLLRSGISGQPSWKNCEFLYTSDLFFLIIKSCKVLRFHLPPAEFKGRVSGAAAVAAAGRQQPPSSAGVHVSSPGVCN